MLKRLVMVLVLAGALVFAAGASASARDRNNDRIPDRWEKKHDLSLKVKQAKRDQDADGFKNYAEWRANTDPRDVDTDDDGTEDDDEQAGTVKSFVATPDPNDAPVNGVLTITPFGGGADLTGTVTADTEIECGVDDDSTPGRDEDEHGDEDSHADEDEHGDEDSHADEDSHGDEDEHGDEDGHSASDTGHHDDDGEACPAGALVAGAIVEEAELKIMSGGMVVWTEIELRK